jgi:hypothetical protein
MIEMTFCSNVGFSIACKLGRKDTIFFDVPIFFCLGDDAMMG